ncbi:MAG: cell division protein FtsZ [Candidatus Nealsonbacteria bacterium]|nr:MAG: cell division protein FtsZ [Candidatus Nealsonbacteria bacterium]
MISSTKIKVVGVGGSGGNAILRMRKFGIKGVELIAINTDYQDLRKVKADVKLKIGGEITHGLGTGMNPEIGEAAAKQSRGEIKEVLKGADMVFITGGLGGGTGSGAAPVVAKIAKNLGALTVAIVTLPFSFEGAYRKKIAENSRDLLKRKVDALLVIKNDRLLEILDPKMPILNAFWVCDDILREAVKGISDLILLPGIVNVGFADVKSILENSGTVLFGIGKSRTEKRAEEAVRFALSSPLLDLTPKGAKGVLFNVSGEDIALSEIEEIGKIITEEINPKARVIFGAVQDEKLNKGEIKVTVIITGF